MQLTVDHDLTNEDELLRLSHTGLDIDKLHQSTYSKLYPFLKIYPGNLNYLTIYSDSSAGNSSRLLTRCLGNYTVKGGYKDFDLFHSASIEPVIAEAEITGPIVLDDSCR
jgi:TAK1-binding protein 1